MEMLFKNKDNLLSLMVDINATNIQYYIYLVCIYGSDFRLDSVFNVINRKYAVCKLDQLPGRGLQTRSVWCLMLSERSKELVKALSAGNTSRIDRPMRDLIWSCALSIWILPSLTGRIQILAPIPNMSYFVPVHILHENIAMNFRKCIQVKSKRYISFGDFIYTS